MLNWNEGLTHKFFKILSVLSIDEIFNQDSYILNERAPSSTATREVPKVTIKVLLARLKGQGIYFATEWVKKKKNKR
jgi:hypothetical protein